MSFFNPLSFLLFLSVHSFNLFQMNSELAKDLSGTYSLVNTKESILPSPCPEAFDIEFIPSNQPDLFVLKNKIQYNGLSASKPRLLPIDGQTRNLPSGQMVKGEVTQPNSIEVEIFNGKNLQEKLVETFEFEDDGTLLYSTEHIVGSQKVASMDTFCRGSRYRKIL